MATVPEKVGLIPPLDTLVMVFHLSVLLTLHFQLTRRRGLALISYLVVIISECLTSTIGLKHVVLQRRLAYFGRMLERVILILFGHLLEGKSHMAVIVCNHLTLFRTFCVLQGLRTLTNNFIHYVPIICDTY